MTAEELLLQEYAEWLQIAASAVPDYTPAAFLLERHNEANQRRIDEALERFDKYADGDGSSGPANVLIAIRRILQDDRPYTINTTLTGQTERIYT
jgi:hypothetical protein